MKYKVNQVVFDNWKIIKKLKATLNEKSEECYEIQNVISRKRAVFRVLSYVDMMPEQIEFLKERIEQIKSLNQCMIEGRCPFAKLEQYKIVRNEEGFDVLICQEKLTSFDEYREQRVEIGYEQIVKIGIELCRALEICEKEGIVHGAVGMDSILIGEDGKAKLGMFQITDVCGQKKGLKNKYYAPERYLGLEYDNTSDVYSLGLLLYECLNNGIMPFMDELSKDYSKIIVKRLQGEILPAIIGIDDNMMHILRKACAFEPHQRYATAISLENALKSIATGSTVVEKQKSSVGKQRSRKKVNWFVVMCSVALVAVVVGSLLIVDKMANKSEEKEEQTSEQLSEEEQTSEQLSEEEQTLLRNNWQMLYSTFSGMMSNTDIDYMLASKEEVAEYLKNNGYIFEDTTGNWKTEVLYGTSMEENDMIHARYLFEKNQEEFDTNNDLYIDTKIIDNGKYRKVVWYADYQESRLKGEQVKKSSVVPHRNKIILRYGQDDMLKNLGITLEMLEWAKGSPVWQDEIGNQWYCKNTQKVDYGITIDSCIEIGYETENGKKYYLEYLFGESLLVGIGECKWK